MLTLVEGRPTKDGIAHLSGESRKIVRRIHGTALLRDKSKDLATIHHPKMDRAFLEIRCPYFFAGPEDSMHLLGDMVTAIIYFWNNPKLDLWDGEKSAQSEKSHIDVEAVEPDPTASAAPSGAICTWKNRKVLSLLASVKGVQTSPNRRKSPATRPLKRSTKWSL